MKTSVRYLKKPSPLKLSRILVFQLSKGVWCALAGLNLRGYDITCSTSSSQSGKCTQRGVVFGTEDDDFVELRFHPETEEESDIVMTCQNVHKDEYSAIMVSRKVFSKGLDKYCRKS